VASARYVSSLYYDRGGGPLADTLDTASTYSEAPSAFDADHLGHEQFENSRIQAGGNGHDRSRCGRAHPCSKTHAHTE
jgi:hypothetical protein